MSINSVLVLDVDLKTVIDNRGYIKVDAGSMQTLNKTS